MRIADLLKMFKYINKREMGYELRHNEYKTEKGFLAHLEKVNEHNRERAEQPDIKELRINIEWRKSRTWGMNPHAEYRCWYVDGTYKEGTATCSGCGYDKESSVIARVFNDCAKGMLYRRRNTRKNIPYGVYLKDCCFPYYEGGIGTSCYYRISDFIGGLFTQVADGKTFSAFLFTNKKAGVRKLGVC